MDFQSYLIEYEYGSLMFKCELDCVEDGRLRVITGNEINRFICGRCCCEVDVY